MRLGRKEVGQNYPAYFIADIGSNHEGSFDRAVSLINLAAEAGADAVKFQNFKADTIVSDYGFKTLGKLSHQKGWSESVYDTYKKYELHLEWMPRLKAAADKASIDFLTTPYSPNMLSGLAPHVCAWKIGSGDITYDELVKAVAEYDKPILLGTGASSKEDVFRALDWLIPNENIVLMQCNTNYTGDNSNFYYLNLRVLGMWRMWVGHEIAALGLSDHTPGHSAVLGAVTIGARVIEKHFTDSNDRAGPDHGFAMTPISWRWMVEATRELEKALGSGIKRVEDNEIQTVISQRRAIRAKNDIPVGKIFERNDFVMLRPCPPEALPPYSVGELIGKRCEVPIKAGDYVRF